MKSNFIETKKAVDDITSAIDKQIASANELNTKIIALNSSYSKVPTEYLNNQKEIVNANNKIVESEKQVATAMQKKQTLTQQQKTDLQIVNVEKRREAVLNSQVAGEYRKLSTAVAQASEKYQNLIVRGRLAGQSQRAFNTELRNAQKEFQTLQTKVLSADKAVQKWNRTNERTISLGRDLLGAFGVVGGVTLFAMITKDIFEQTKEIQSLNKALQLVTDTQDNFYRQQTFLADISNRYGVELNGLTKQFTQFYVSAKDKISGNEIQQIFESITKAGASMGLSVESQQRAFLALNQMMSKGTIQAEELRGQLGEALPGAFGIMAKAVGVTEKELAKMMKAGDLLASDVLPKFAKQLEITYGIQNVTRIENLTGAQNRLTNAWRNFVSSLDEDGNKLSKFFSNVLNEATSTIDAWREIFSSASTLRKKELDSIRVSGEQLAKTNLKTISDADQKAKYASDMIISLQKQKVEILTQANKLEASIRNIKTSKDPNINDAGGRGLRPYWEKEVNRQQQELAKLNNKLKETEGLIIGYGSALERKKPIVEKDTELTKDQIKAQKELADQLERELRIRYELSIATAERELRLLKAKLDNENLYINERLDLLDDIAQKETEIELKKYQENIRLHKDSNDQMVIDAIEFKNQIDDINKERLDNGLKALDNYYKEVDDYNKKYQGEGLKMETELSIEGFEKWKEGADKAKKSTEDLENATKSWIESFKNDFISESGFDTLFMVLEDKIANFGKDFETTFLAISEIAQETFSFISELSNQRFAEQYANLDREKEIALAFAGDSVSAREEIERQYQQKQKEIKKNEFSANKEFAKVNSIINTAQAVTAFLAKGQYGYALLAGVLGAAQIAIISAQKMPAYKDGTDNHIGGLMMVNDAKGSNYREKIVTPDGKIISPQGRNVIMNAPKGTKVYTDKQWDELMFNDGLNNILTSNGMELPKININTPNLDLTPVVDAINQKESVNLNVDRNGIRTLITNGNTTREIMNNRIRGIGKIL